LEQFSTIWEPTLGSQEPPREPLRSHLGAKKGRLVQPPSLLFIRRGSEPLRDPPGTLPGPSRDPPGTRLGPLWYPSGHLWGAILGLIWASKTDLKLQDGPTMLNPQRLSPMGWYFALYSFSYQYAPNVCHLCVNTSRNCSVYLYRRSQVCRIHEDTVFLASLIHREISTQRWYYDAGFWRAGGDTRSV